MNRRLNYEQWLEEHPNIKSVRGRDIGGAEWAAGMLYVSLPCSKCGRERWVLLKKLLVGGMTSTLCRNCWEKTEKRGEANPNWKGGRHFDKTGYILCFVPSNDFFYPMARVSRQGQGGYVYEHRLLMAKYLNRCLLTWEIIHHKNGVKDDNRLENLELIEGGTKHLSYTFLQKELKRLQKENANLRTRLKEYE